MDEGFTNSFSESFSPGEELPEPVRPAPRRAVPRILVIEDNEFDRDILLTLLHYNGYDVLESEGGMNGLAVARREQPDLIIVDLRLPDLHGLIVGEILKSSPETRAIPVFAISSFEVVKGELEQAGFDAYYRKPIRPGILISAIDAALRRGFEGAA